MATHENYRYLIMRSLLRHNVPRFIAHIKNRGGVSVEEWEWLICESENPDHPVHMIERGDEYLLFPKNEEIFKKRLFILVKAIAIMSFIAGGIYIFDSHFCSEVEGFVAWDESET